jgi:hypothetical protein
MKNFFTIPDPDLTQESSVDPMGLQVIWTAYGQEIFNDKLTTIANDLRVFTFNLFHNHLINRLFQDYTEEIQEAKNYYKLWQTESDIKTGLLVFLEDLVTHVFYNNEDSSVDSLGILGMSKARILYNSKGQDEIFVTANKRLGLLKNQINLGMTGRYKGPMMNMQFFDRSFAYLPKTWEQVNRFMNKWHDAMELQDNLVKLITKYLFESPKRDYPFLSIQEVKSNRLWKPLSEGYLKCFGSGKLPKDIREYWKDRLGLNAGAPKALFSEIGKLPEGLNFSYQEVFINARKQLANEPTELAKVDIILEIEPFLSHSEYLLRYLAQMGIKSIKDEEKGLEKLRKEIIASANFPLANAQSRTKSLFNAMMAQGSTVEWIKGILEYHRKVLEQRGGHVWIELDENSNIKHYFAPSLPEHLNTIAKYLVERPWWHTYYLATLRSIYQGLK